MERVLKEFYTIDVKRRLEKSKIILKKSAKWCDLADYYLALQYVYNIIDNDLSDNLNSRIGGEMLKVFYSVENKYAEEFFEYYRELMGW